MKISVSKRDGCVQACGTTDEIVTLILVLSNHTDVIRSRWVVAGRDGGTSMCWPLAGVDGEGE